MQIATIARIGLELLQTTNWRNHPGQRRSHSRGALIPLALGKPLHLVEEIGRLTEHAPIGFLHAYEGCLAVRKSPARLLIGESRQPPEVPPSGAREISSPSSREFSGGNPRQL